VSKLGASSNNGLMDDIDGSLASGFTMVGRVLMSVNNIMPVPIYVSFVVTVPFSMFCGNCTSGYPERWY
jgi:hypothetical protein